MIRTNGVRIWLATSPVEMRRSFDALAEHVRTIPMGMSMQNARIGARTRGYSEVPNGSIPLFRQVMLGDELRRLRSKAGLIQEQVALRRRHTRVCEYARIRLQFAHV